MTVMSPLVFVCAGTVPFLAGAAGIALFVVGLVKKKPAMWGSGIALGLISLAIVVVGIGMVAWFGFRSASTVSRKAVVRARTAVIQAAAEADPDEAFRTCTDLPLPGGAKVVGFDSITYPPPAGQSNYYFKLMVPRGFEDFLAAHFTEGTWAEIGAAMVGEESRAVGFWDLTDGENKRCYQRTHRDSPADPDRMVTSVAYDPNAGMAYVISVQEWEK